ncbi:MAG: prolyl-tRNA synthetase associated domain-containing protein [Bacteroidota bacterium]
MKEERNKVLTYLEKLNISYVIYEHPPLPTIEEAEKHWKEIEATHCKNLFFRNHKGNKHYLVIIDHRQALGIHDLEKRLKQGKLSFASEKRMEKYLGIRPGSVSIFGLIHDEENHVHVFLDNNLKKARKISFHPNDNTATLVISFEDFERFLKEIGNSYEYLEVY